MSLKFYEVDVEYTKYLSQFEKKIPYVDYSKSSAHDKFFCGIVLEINNHKYFAPISSFRKPQRTNFIIRNEDNNPIASIRFSFMIPVPDDMLALKPIEKEVAHYQRLLNFELRYCRRHEKEIRKKARLVYNAVVYKTDEMIVKNCCDFLLLERKYAEFQQDVAKQ
jgi:protein AbiQ